MPSGPKVASLAPIIAILEPTLTSPKNGPAAVPVNFQKYEARGGSMSADSHVSSEVWERRVPISIDVPDRIAAADDAVGGALEDAFGRMQVGECLGIAARERLLLFRQQLFDCLAVHRLPPRRRLYGGCRYRPNRAARSRLPRRSAQGEGGLVRRSAEREGGYTSHLTLG